MSGACRYIGFVRGLESFESRWVAVRANFRSRAAHDKPLGLHSCGNPLVYNACAVSVVRRTAQLFPLDGTMLQAEHMTIARILAAPMYELSPGIASEAGGPRISTCSARLESSRLGMPSARSVAGPWPRTRSASGGRHSS